MEDVSLIVYAAPWRVAHGQLQEIPDLTVLFDTSPEKFPWRAPVPREIEARRAQMDDILIFDILLTAGGVRQPHALYPPRDVQTLRKLLDAIEATSYDGLKKDCLIYFLLKWHQDDREVQFMEERCIPPQFVALADAYWYLDSGLDIPVSLVDPHTSIPAYSMCLFSALCHFSPTLASTETTSRRFCKQSHSRMTLAPSSCNTFAPRSPFCPSQTTSTRTQ